jgi:hypothetical protein
MLDVFLDGEYAGTIFRRSGPHEAFYYRPKRTMMTSKDYRTLDRAEGFAERQGTARWRSVRLQAHLRSARGSTSEQTIRRVADEEDELGRTLVTVHLLIGGPHNVQLEGTGRRNYADH